VAWYQTDDRVHVRVEQATSHPSVDFFEMQIPIAFIGAGGDSLVVFDHDFSGQEYTLTLPFDVDSVAFDPELRMLSAGNVVTREVTSVDPAEAAESVRLFPNPAGDRLFLDLTDPILAPVRLRLYDSGGRLLRQLPYRTEIAVDELAPGNYVLQIIGKNWEKSFWFQKE
jgi:hypothetical protein